jgi:hypothetical protein
VTRRTRTGWPRSGPWRWATSPSPATTRSHGASIVDPGGALPAIGFLRVPEGKVVKNRVHIDIRVAAAGPVDQATREQWIRATVADLVAAGATAVREESYGGELGRVVMQDPEGSEFCVA